MGNESKKYCNTCKWWDLVNDDYLRCYVCKNPKLSKVIPILKDTEYPFIACGLGCIYFEEK